MDISYILNQLGEDSASFPKSMVPPIAQTSNFVFESVEDIRRAMADEFNAFIYSRGNNPVTAVLRQKLAALEGAEDALVFGSGMGAIAAAVLAHVEQGAHVVCVAHPYSWTRKLLADFLPRFGVLTDFADGRDLKNLEHAIKGNTRLLYLESPNTFSYDLQDLRKVSDLARSKGVVTAIDNSYATPIFQRPLDLGIDISIHSATKYLSGHSDVLAGVVCASRKVIRRMFEQEFMTLGGTIAPMNAWLMLRGLRSLKWRMERHFESAKKICGFLEQSPYVHQVLYPFSPSFPQFELARQQMQGAGSLMSIQLTNRSLRAIEAFCNRLKRFAIGVSWGGYESLVLPACAGIPAADFNPAETSHRLIRLYIGWEDPECIIQDLQQALEASSLEV